jgi:CubicO group peptidase (beta-lactamase class C family)
MLEACSAAIEHRVFPGCALAFGKTSGAVHYVFAGTLSYSEGSPAVNARTWFDLASLTKPIATASASMTAVAAGVLDIETPVTTYFREFSIRNALVKHLLSHSSGLAAYVPYYRFCRDANSVISEIVRSSAEYEPGSRSVYSDLGFMLLARILENLNSGSMREVTHDLLEKLRIDEVRFGPIDVDRFKVAPTELDFTLHHFAHGTVHDENARLFENGAGHAGLFGTITGVAQFAQAVLATRQLRQRSVLPPQILKSWTARQAWLPESSWGLGWDTPTEQSSAGPALSSLSFGHTGFTGTSVWIDPRQDLFICILSNRVHPSRRTEGIKDFRRRIHTLAATCLAA